MLEESTVRMLERHWEEGWNAANLETIMAPFGTDIVFSSPFVPALTGDTTSSEIRGYASLRDYVADSLRRAAGIRYTLDASYVGVDSVILAYTCHLPDGTDRTGVDSMRLDSEGKVVDWRCHYSFRPAEVRHLITD
ncbi:MAG: nuclear transport factor 2 family protein [Acidimicrobiales bacterium]